jgi:uncharacterized delta-60 repeat protein
MTWWSNLSRTLTVAGMLGSLLVVSPVGAGGAAVGEGEFDDDFAQDGRARASFVSNGNDEARGVALAPDGKIVVAGLTFNAVTGLYDMGVVRYNRDGTLDPTFNHGGLKGVGFGAGVSAEAYDVVVQPDGRIIVGGRLSDPSSHWGMARLTAGGALDPTFGSGGRRFFPTIDSGLEGLTDLALQPDGRIVAVGSAVGPNGLDFTVIRLKPSGAFDTTFGTGGIVHTSPGPNSDFPESVLVQPDGKILVGGSAAFVGTSSFQFAAALVRYRPGGGLDGTWGSGGIAVTDLSVDDNELVNAIVRLSNGDIVAAGAKSAAGVTTNGGLLLRYAAGGVLKPSSASGDPGWAAKPAFTQVQSVLQQRDGKLVAIGSVGNGNQFEVARYDRGFRPDPDFASGGEETVPFGAHDFDDAFAGVVQRDGKIVVVGRSWTGLFDADAGGDIYNYATVRLVGDATAPTGQRIVSLPAFSRSRSVHVAWRASDDNTGVRSYDVRVRSARASRSSYGDWKGLVSRTTKRSTTVTAKAGRTYCFAVRARDWAGNVGAWSSPRCTGVPVDDRSLTASGSWAADGGRSDYLRTLRVSDGKGDTLSARVAFRKLALLVRTCDGCGKVRVLLGGTSLGTFDLDARRTRHRVLVPVVSGTTLRSGVLRLRQVSNGHEVAIDGVAVNLG